MSSLRSSLCSAALASVVVLTGCTKGVFSNPLYLAVTITPRPASVPAGGSVVLTGAASNNLGVPSWSIANASNTPSAGTLTTVAGQPNSILYTAPGTPPIYASGPPGFTQGVVSIQATVNPPAGSSGLTTATDSVSVFITTPSVSVSLSPAVVPVPLGESATFTGYAVGNVNNGLTWEVNGIPGGSPSLGTITSQGVYTAPSAIPMTGSAITITVVSQADSTRSATATVNLQ